MKFVRILTILYTAAVRNMDREFFYSTLKFLLVLKLQKFKCVSLLVHGGDEKVAKYLKFKYFMLHFEYKKQRFLLRIFFVKGTTKNSRCAIFPTITVI